MKKAVIFDMYETLITHYESPLYFCREMAIDAGIDFEKFHKQWTDCETERSTGKISFEKILTDILIENGRYSSGGFNTPPLWGETRGIKSDCNTL